MVGEQNDCQIYLKELIYFSRFLSFMYVCIPIRVHAIRVQVPVEIRRWHMTPRTGVTNGCDLFDTGVGN